jgi:hypothetical protein
MKKANGAHNNLIGADRMAKTLRRLAPTLRQDRNVAQTADERS